MNATDARRVVSVELPVGLDPALHSPIDQSPIKVGKVRPVLVVLAAAGNGLPGGKLRSRDAAVVPADAPALPIVLCVPGKGKSKDGQPAELLTREILPSETPASA